MKVPSLLPLLILVPALLPPPLLLYLHHVPSYELAPSGRVTTAHLAFTRWNPAGWLATLLTTQTGAAPDRTAWEKARELIGWVELAAILTRLLLWSHPLWSTYGYRVSSCAIWTLPRSSMGTWWFVRHWPPVCSSRSPEQHVFLYGLWWTPSEHLPSHTPCSPICSVLMSRAAHDSALLEHRRKAPGLGINNGLICFLRDWYTSSCDLRENSLLEGTELLLRNRTTNELSRNTSNRHELKVNQGGVWMWPVLKPKVCIFSGSMWTVCGRSTHQPLT